MRGNFFLLTRPALCKLRDIQLDDHIRLSRPDMKLGEVRVLRRTGPDEDVGYIAIVETPADMA